MQKPRIAFQGERGAYSEAAAMQYFQDADLSHFKTFREVFDAVEAGKANFAIVPVENSIEGTVNEVYDLFKNSSLIAVGEHYLRVHHCLIANKGVKFSDIKSAYSHPQALAQCREYLQRNKIEPIAAYDTAGAVKLVKDGHLNNSAAIASKTAAELYDMQVVEEGIEDRKNNFTRFLVMSQSSISQPSAISIAWDVPGKDTSSKTSMIFSVKHVPGALFGILREFANQGINLAKIESRPTKETPWEYNFYMDIEGDINDQPVINAIEAIREKTTFLKIIGSYRRAKLDLPKNA